MSTEDGRAENQGIELSFARLKATIFVPESGQLGPQLTPVQTATTKAAHMVLKNDLVHCTVKNGKTGKQMTILVPTNNFEVMVAK